MSSITASTDITNVKPEELPKFVDLFFQEVVQAINGGLDFQTNFNCQLLSITIGVANADTTLAHNLKRVPSGYIVTSASAPTSVYAGSIANTSSSITLRADRAATVGLLVF